MNEQTKIPKHKLGRATRLATTGVQVGVNYLKYQTRKAITGNDDKSEFHETTARQTYDTFSQLKGGPLKLAQMLSMDRNLIPEQYVDEFSKAQYNAPPLTFPLVVNTFRKEMGKHPDELFEQFTRKAVSGASIGQVHQAEKADQKYAVKIQYPGVANSLKSDLAIVKPLAMRLFQLDAKSLDPYMMEVQERLLEETDYCLELERSLDLVQNSQNLPLTRFPNYFPEFSSKRILTMEWVEGIHLDQYAESDAPADEKQRIAQALWDFYHHQIHQLRLFHADPHPGNFKIHEGELWVLDFGCTKQLGESFYTDYFSLMNPEVLGDDQAFRGALEKIGLLLGSDTPQQRDKLTSVFKESVELLSRPFLEQPFDFSNQAYFDELADFGERTRLDKELSDLSTSRGNANALYLNRTYFGLYHLVGSLNATITAKLPSFAD
ncbi:AarF/ABC1/UbiB kinase family protein [Verrucomicrobiaceae bacterium R5-34]|uniref:AarF/ABC1/UbiB kinase family protein n=1 Tax=Oceaniferula flava TaxID=2800421 RepID=A0AAE2VD73_9BACT|nr:AarF/ABC1/UbiB kinase family protein [Oceaniferula flavus]MBK1829770.1 AarF/ABC1/UbiB kinase family protein [Verrucomicrobiaceae bacterium R5-34]MBK1856425.1 AarF/ABC1/UbiB kinase family protein [Oceaniferula flavus]MBM1137732.1 AarF/ABC1/UbiB kinase family protein [Oceaniferula flavus]